MRPIFLRRWTSCWCIVLMLLPIAPSALAQTETGKSTSVSSSESTSEVEPVDLEAIERSRAGKARRYAIGRRISRYMAEAAELIDEEQPQEAEDLLLKLDARRMNPHERALVYRLLAFIAYGQQQSEKAIGWFEKVLAEEVLPLRDESKVRFSIAQLYAGLENWKQAIAWIDEWMRYEPNPDPLGFYLKAISQYQLGQIPDAIVSTRAAIERGSPRESWLRLLAALYADQQDYDSATAVLEELLLRYPKKKYWVQLSLFQGAREAYDVSLAVQQMAYQQGYLTEDKELMRLARGYLYQNLPYPAAKVLQKGLDESVIEPDSDAYELLANAWIAAREYDRSLPSLQRAADLAEDGNLYVRLGQVHMQREEWAEAAAMFEKALVKGGLDKEGGAILLMGIATYNASESERARRHFLRARKFEDSRAEADRWLEHISRESGAQTG